jgi:Flp pilus assembly protein TadD
MVQGPAAAARIVVWGPLLVLLVLGCGRESSAPDSTRAGFVTSTECQRCHPAAFQAWRGSHHDLAMQRADAETVLGDFAGARFTDESGTSEFIRRGADFLVRTADPAGAPAEHRVQYTFGVEPLQQYLIELPGGRLQALTVAWDTRPADEGGQRWFSLHPDEPTPPGDVLHWAGPANRWNMLCAHCHSTNLRRNYDVERDQYDTTWSEIDVACESCHGPGSSHVAWAAAGADPGAANGLVVDLQPEPAARWVMDSETGIAFRDPPLESRSELEICAPCHSRRSLLSEDVFEGGYLDAHLPALLEAGLYHPDGQILDEVYVYGSFLQSKMYHAGVTCSDCHEPHSLELRGTTESVCAQCHAPQRFASFAHHQHPSGSRGARCVSCHMPSRTYMRIDDRRDHGFRVPRPDLSVKLGTPNTCGGCHTEHDAEWAMQQVAGWPHTKQAGSAHFSEALGDVRAGSSAGAQRTLEDAGEPAIVRATALSELARIPGALGRDAIEPATDDADPLLRIAAARAGEVLPPRERVAALAPLLSDPVRAVRIEAARTLADAPESTLTPAQRSRLDVALEEYRAVQRLNADQPSAHVNLGLLHMRRGELELAAAAYVRALRVGSYFMPAYVNLAETHRLQGRERDVERVLREGLAEHPDSGDLQHALGLSRVRQGQPERALEPLAKAAALQPGNARFAYVYAVALHSNGRTDRALEVLGAAHQRRPGDRSILEALVTIHLEAGKLEQALHFARRLESAAPGDPQVRRLREQIESELRR